MNVGLTMSTHGLLARDERDVFLQRLEPEQMRPVELAQLAERLGYHSLWFSDTSAWAATPVRSTPRTSPARAPIRPGQ